MTGRLQENRNRKGGLQRVWGSPQVKAMLAPKILLLRTAGEFKDRLKKA